MRLIKILLIFFISVTHAVAADYFIAQSGAGAGDGSSYADRMSIANYNSGNLDASTDPGDTIYVCGALTTILNTTEGGDSDNQLTFNWDCSTQGGTDGSFSSVSGYTTCGGTAFVTSAICVDEAYTTWYWVNITASVADGFWLAEDGDYTIIKNSYIHDMTDPDAGGILFAGADNCTIGGSESASNLLKNIGQDFASGVGAGEDIGFTGAIALDNTISYNELAGNGTSTGTDGVMCANDESANVGDVGHENIVEYNYIHDHNKENEIDIKGGEYWIIRLNIIDGPTSTYDSGTTIIIFHAGVNNLYFYGNVVRNDPNDGINPYDSNAGGDPVQYIHIWSNLIYNMAWSGIIFNAGANDTTDYARMWNNTIVDNGNNPTVSGQVGLRSLGTWTNSNDFYSLNNIIAFNRDGQGSAPTRQLYGMAFNAGAMTSDYNQYYSADGNITIYYNSSDRTFAYWQGTVGQDANSTEADPGFNDRASDDYTTSANLTGTDSSTMSGWHTDYDKGLDEDSDINAQQCGSTPGGVAYCAKGLILADRDSFNGGTWGKGAFVYGSSGGAAAPSKPIILIIN